MGKGLSMKKIFFISYILLSAWLFVQAATSRPEPEYKDFTFLVNSDIHQTESTSRRDAQQSSFFRDIITPDNNTSAVLFAGDLTDNGRDTEFAVFTEKWIRPITNLMPTKPHMGLYLCKGNHDEASGSNTQLLKYLKKEYGDFCYSFDINGLHFACCDKYPQKICLGGVLSWLKKDLKKIESINPKIPGSGTPVVIFFHYNITGPFSEWWSVDCGNCMCASSKSEKDYFFDAIKNYNIQGIFFGHVHCSYSALWRKKFRITGVGGDQYAFCQYKPSTKTVDIKFKDEMGRVYPWESLPRTEFVEL